MTEAKAHTIETMTERVREFNRQSMILRQEIDAFSFTKSALTERERERMFTYASRATDELRKLLALLNMRQEDVKMGESAVSGVEFVEDLQSPAWCSHEDAQTTLEGF